MNRRSFLKGFGTVSVLVTAGVVYRAYDRGLFQIGQGPDFEAWDTWRTESVPTPLRLVRAGILAASPHNTQPWLFQVDDSSITLFADRSRHLGTMDPYFREMFIGLGCAIENIVMAGRAEGYTCQVSLPKGPLPVQKETFTEPVAVIQLTPGPKVVDALYEAIPHRHTNRGAYDTNKEIPASLLTTARTLVCDDAVNLTLLTTPDAKQRFAKGTVQATQTIIADRQMSADSHRWFRMDQQSMDQHRDGVTLEGVGLSPIVLRLAKFMPGVSGKESDTVWLKNTRDVHTATAAAFGCLLVRDLYSQVDNLQAGRVWQRLHLWATTQGIAVQPLNQLMECIDRERQVGKPDVTANKLTQLIGRQSWYPTFAFRMGYPVQAALPVPRRPVTEVLLRQAV
jgi:hypothetical protein